MSGIGQPYVLAQYYRTTNDHHRAARLPENAVARILRPSWVLGDVALSRVEFFQCATSHREITIADPG